MENIPSQNPKKGTETKDETNKRTNREVFAALELVSKLGISIAIIAGSFLYGGIYLDRRVGSGHWFLFIGLVLSVVVSIYDIFVLLEPFIGSDKKKNFLKRKKK